MSGLICVKPALLLLTAMQTMLGAFPGLDCISALPVLNCNLLLVWCNLVGSRTFSPDINILGDLFNMFACVCADTLMAEYGLKVMSWKCA